LSELREILIAELRLAADHGRQGTAASEIGGVGSKILCGQLADSCREIELGTKTRLPGRLVARAGGECAEFLRVKPLRQNQSSRVRVK